MQARLFIEKTVYAFHWHREGGGIVVELHIDHPNDDIATIDIKAWMHLKEDGNTQEEMVTECLRLNNIDPNIYETKNF